MNPADNPKEHKRMSKDYQTDEEGDEDKNMTENTEPETDGGESELDALNVRIRNENTYEVGNPESGTAYVVNMNNADHDGTMTCECPDYRFRAQEGEFRACKHIQKVIEVSPDRITSERLAFNQLVREYEILSEKLDSVTQSLTNIQANTHADTGVSSENRQPTDEQYVNAGDAAGNGEQMAAVSADEAAEKLQTAFDDSVRGMNVEAHNGRVWVNKSPDAPDFTFDAFLSGPSLMQYDPDGDSPGQYYKNYVEPGDVNDYISEVLE